MAPVQWLQEPLGAMGWQPGRLVSTKHFPTSNSLMIVAQWLHQSNGSSPMAPMAPPIQWRQPNGANGASMAPWLPMAPEPLGAIAQWLLEPYNLACWGP